MFSRKPQENKQLGSKVQNYYFQIIPLKLSTSKALSQSKQLKFAIYKGRQKFEQTQYTQGNLQGQNTLLFTNKLKLNFVVINYSTLKSQQFSLKITQRKNQIQTQIGQYVINYNVYVDNFLKNSYGAFQENIILDSDFQLNVQLYVEKKRFLIEKLVRQVHAQQQKNKQPALFTKLQKVIQKNAFTRKDPTKNQGQNRSNSFKRNISIKQLKQQLQNSRNRSKKRGQLMASPHKIRLVGFDRANKQSNTALSPLEQKIQQTIPVQIDIKPKQESIKKQIQQAPVQIKAQQNIKVQQNQIKKEETIENTIQEPLPQVKITAQIHTQVPTTNDVPIVNVCVSQSASIQIKQEKNAQNINLDNVPVTVQIIQNQTIQSIPQVNDNTNLQQKNIVQQKKQENPVQKQQNIQAKVQIAQNNINIQQVPKQQQIKPPIVQVQQINCQQQKIAIQPVVQPIVQPVLQPVLQQAVQQVVQPIAQVSKTEQIIQKVTQWKDNIINTITQGITDVKQTIQNTYNNMIQSKKEQQQVKNENTISLIKKVPSQIKQQILIEEDKSQKNLQNVGQLLTNNQQIDQKSKPTSQIHLKQTQSFEIEPKRQHTQTIQGAQLQKIPQQQIIETSQDANQKKGLLQFISSTIGQSGRLFTQLKEMSRTSIDGIMQATFKKSQQNAQVEGQVAQGQVQEGSAGQSTQLSLKKKVTIVTVAFFVIILIYMIISGLSSPAQQVKVKKAKVSTKNQAKSQPKVEQKPIKAPKQVKKAKTNKK